MGDTKYYVTAQAISSLITYCAVLDQYGLEELSKYIECEPSGRAYNYMALTGKGLPHNPLINSGAMMCCALFEKEFSNDKRFEDFAEHVKKLVGGAKIDFNNEMFLSEMENANRNRSLLYMMEESGALPPESGVKKTLEFYT